MLVLFPSTKRDRENKRPGSDELAQRAFPRHGGSRPRQATAPRLRRPQGSGVGVSLDMLHPALHSTCRGIQSPHESSASEGGRRNVSRRQFFGSKCCRDAVHLGRNEREGRLEDRPSVDAGCGGSRLVPWPLGTHLPRARWANPKIPHEPGFSTTAGGTGAAPSDSRVLLEPRLHAPSPWLRALVVLMENRRHRLRDRRPGSITARRSACVSTRGRRVPHHYVCAGRGDSRCLPGGWLHPAMTAKVSCAGRRPSTGSDPSTGRQKREDS